GILGEKAASTHGDEAGAPTMAEVAVMHEFGTDRIPMRSLIRTPLERVKAETHAMERRLAMKVYRGTMTSKEASEFLGAWAAGLLSDGVRKGLPVPPLAESTKAARRGSVHVPLFDTGQLASSISYEVK